MDQMQHNPLAKYFRAPGIAVRLPSGGNFQPAGNVTFTPGGDVSVLPMRGADEMLMKSPDALMNGHAIEQTIKSCVPGILNPQLLPTPDVDAILLAIRAATYGDQMDIECTCPHCSTENAFAFSISAVLDSASELDPEYPVRLDDNVLVYVRPFNLKASTKISMVAFQEARKMQLLDNGDVSEDEKQKALRNSFDNINVMNTDALASSVAAVVVPEGTIEDARMIREFVDNISTDWLNKIEEQLRVINESGITKKQTVVCVKCEKEFETSVEFDPSNFFGTSS
jgi:T4 bacteriophage base plate protein